MHAMRPARQCNVCSRINEQPGSRAAQRGQGFTGKLFQRVGAQVFFAELNQINPFGRAFANLCQQLALLLRGIAREQTPVSNVIKPQGHG